MSSARRFASPLALAGAFGVMCLVLLLAMQSPAAAKAKHRAKAKPLTYARLTKIQRRMVSEPLALALGPQPRIVVPQNDDGGAGVDGLPSTPPASYSSPAAAGSPVSYFPTSASGCAASFGSNTKVNQNCLNLTDPAFHGRGQANNEESISVNPFNTKQLVASDNNYIRGDGTCGAYYSRNGGRSWNDSVVPNSFTIGPAGYPQREYWQAGGDTSVAWDTRGNAYISCQVFNRGGATSPNPDFSSGFLLFRSTQNGGASWNFPGRPSAPIFFDPTGASKGNVLVDKALMTVDDNVSSPYRDRIYVTWTQFAADGSAYIYEVHSDDYGESFSKPAVVSAANPACTNTFGAGTSQGPCNENQFSDPFVGPDGNLYVVWDNFNNQPASPTATENHYQVLLAKSTDGGGSFSPPVKVSDYYDLPDCNTYQGPGADPGRSCVPEKGSSTKSVFRATNYPSGQVNPKNPNVVAVTFGSYINKYSNENNGCAPTGFAASGNPTYTGVKTAGACNNKILLNVSTDGGNTFTGGTDPRKETVVTQSGRQPGTDQFWQWAAFTTSGTLAVDYYDRQYGNDETTGSSDFSLSGSNDLLSFGQTRVTTSSMPAPTEFEGPNGGQFYGDYIGLTAAKKAYPIWSDTRSPALFLCPGTGAPGVPPQLCGAKEANGEQANDEDSFMAALNVPTGNNHSKHTRTARR
jgi:hypothetical protein